MLQCPPESGAAEPGTRSVDDELGYTTLHARLEVLESGET